MLLLLDRDALFHRLWYDTDISTMSSAKINRGKHIGSDYICLVFSFN